MLINNIQARAGLLENRVESGKKIQMGAVRVAYCRRHHDKMNLSHFSTETEQEEKKQLY